MHAPTALCLLLLATLGSSQALASAVKGHSSQVQRVEQSPAKGAPIVQQQQQQQQERQPKAAAPAQPILESSKKVYNDESIRRSAAQLAAPADPTSIKSAQQVVAQAQQPVLVASEPQVIAAAQPVVAVPVAKPVEPVVAAAQPVPVVPVNKPVDPVVAVPVAKPVEPVVAAAQPVVVAVQPVVEAVQPVVVAAQPVVAVPAAKPVDPMAVEPKSAAAVVVQETSQQAKPEAVAEKKDELPAQSVRSAPIKDEQVPSRVIVEQVVPAKPVAAEQAAPVVPVAPEQPVKPAVVEKPAGVVESVLQAKKDDEPSAVQAPKSKQEVVEAPIEVPAPDPGLVLSEPIDSTTKLLIDLDEHVQKFLPAEDKQEPVAPAKEQVLINGVDYSPAHSPNVEQQPSGKSSAPALVPYSDTEPIVPPLPQALDKVEKATGAVASPVASPQPQQVANTRQASGGSSHQHQSQQQVITQLLDQLDTLQNRIQDTINQLVARRRYVMSALLRPMGTYVRRVRTNLERLQNRVNQLQAAAVSVGGNQNGQRPGGFVDAAAIETIRRRIDDISKRISDIVNRIRFSLTPTSAPLNNNGK